jgi:hypothetical protein
VDRNILDFLIATGAELNVDEYDMTGDDEDATAVKTRHRWLLESRPDGRARRAVRPALPRE